MILQLWLGTSAVIWLAFTVYAIWKFLTTEDAAPLSRRARAVYRYGECILIALLITALVWLVIALGQWMLDTVSKWAR